MPFKLALERLFTAKGAVNKLKYLRANGFTYTEAQTLGYKHPKAIKFEHIYRLCLAFNCTPNDLFSLEKSDEQTLPAEHPLKTLIREPIANIPELLKKLPPDKITELSKHIESLSKVSP